MTKHRDFLCLGQNFLKCSESQFPKSGNLATTNVADDYLEKCLTHQMKQFCYVLLVYLIAVLK